MPYDPETERGLIEIHDARIWMSPEFDATIAQSKLGYSDGTKGSCNTPLCISPAAFGATTFLFDVVDGRPHFHNFQILGGEVPGNQSVPRSEAWAGIVLLNRAHANAVARLGIDASYSQRARTIAESFPEGKTANYGIALFDPRLKVG